MNRVQEPVFKCNFAPCLRVSERDKFLGCLYKKSAERFRPRGRAGKVKHIPIPEQ